MKIAFIIGTRPEIIKMSPLIDEVDKRGIDNIVIHTGQHYDYEMSQQFFLDLETQGTRLQHWSWFRFSWKTDCSDDGGY